MQPAYIYDAIRTPRARAKPDGGLSQLTPVEVLKQLFTALQQRNDFDPTIVNDVVLGCVSQFGEQAGNIARTSVVNSNWPDSIPGMSLNRFCSSSLDACCLAANQISAGNAQLGVKALVAGGVESMSRVPMLADQPTWMIDPQTILQSRAIPLGNAADLIANQQNFRREELDAYALQSQQRACQAQSNGHFDKSLISINSPCGLQFSIDETIRKQISLGQLAALKPSFSALSESQYGAQLLETFPALKDVDHLHTAGNSPAMADGASLLLIGEQELSDIVGRPARAQIIGYHSFCGPVDQVLTGGILSAQRLLKASAINVSDIDLVEFNESFAGPTLQFIRDMSFDPAIVNVNGGAIALGHPMGATGGILLGTLLDELERQDKELGLVSICGATGSGTSMIIRRV